MPELPEVECLARALQNRIVGRRIESIKFLRPDLREPLAIDDIKRLCEGATVVDVYRRSKYVMVAFADRPELLALHLGMSGQFIELSTDAPQKPHTHVIFEFNETFFHYVDPRRFGRLLTVAALEEHPFFKDLGVEPLGVHNLAKHLANGAQSRSQPVKNFLMDHTVVVGVGNIYAAESLYRAAISPLRQARSLTLVEWRKLAEAIKTVLRGAIKARGTTFRDYRGADGDVGGNQVNLQVYGRAGQACYNCGLPILKDVQSGRSTFYCQRCQH